MVPCIDSFHLARALQRPGDFLHCQRVQTVVLHPRFPGRTPWPFSCTVSKLAKFYSSCYMLHITEYWLPVQGFFLKITEFFLQSAGHTVSLIWLCVSANLPAQRGFLFFSVCSKGERRLRTPCCSEPLFRCRGLCIWRVTGSALYFHVLPRKHNITNGLVVDSTVGLNHIHSVEFKRP